MHDVARDPQLGLARVPEGLDGPERPEDVVQQREHLDRVVSAMKALPDNQREAVKEERRLRMDNQPYGKTSEVIGELLFENFANEHSVIGSMADLDAASLEDFANFFRTYYAPNNAVLTIAGDVDAKTAVEKARKYFESIPAGPPVPALDMAEPAQKEERRTVINDPLARLALVDIA